MTLLELLIVILVMLMITAITIPVVAPALAGRQIREAARMVDVFFSGAKNRAQRTGRPVGVVLEQDVPGGSTTLSYAEVPPPYSGDFSNSTINVTASGATIVTSGNIFNQQDIGWYGLVRPGDLIQFNYRSTLYRIYAGEPYLDVNGNGVFDAGTDWYTDTNFSGTYEGSPAGAVQQNNGYLAAAASPNPPYAPNIPSQSTPISPLLPSFGIWTYTYADPALAVKQMSVTGAPQPGASAAFGPSGAVTFQILRQPVPLASGKLQLSSAAAVDLGTTLVNTSAADAVAVAGSGLDKLPTAALWSLATFREFPLFLFPGGTPPPAPYTSRIIVTFSPNGLVDLVYSWDEPTFTYLSGSTVGWQGRQTQGPIYFLIGRRELLGGDPEVLLLMQAGQAPIKPCFNFQDPTNLWVVINPLTGMVATTENVAVDLTVAPPAQSPGNQTALQTYYSSQVYQARSTAREMQAMGGR